MIPHPPLQPFSPLLSTDGQHKLLQSPAFHRGVQALHRRINRIRHGPTLEDMGGTKLDGMCMAGAPDLPNLELVAYSDVADPRAPSEFFKHFGDEVKTQLGIKKPTGKK
jgi:hypothetical protein